MPLRRCHTYPLKGSFRKRITILFLYTYLLLFI